MLHDHDRFYCGWNSWAFILGTCFHIHQLLMEIQVDQTTTLPSTPLAGKELGSTPSGNPRQLEKLTAELSHGTTRLLVDPQSGDSVLMDRLQLGIVLHLPLEIHLSEHVESRFFAHIA